MERASSCCQANGTVFRHCLTQSSEYCRSWCQSTGRGRGSRDRFQESHASLASLCPHLGLVGWWGIFQKVKFFLGKGGTDTPPGPSSSQLLTYSCNKHSLRGGCFGFNLVALSISTYSVGIWTRLKAWDSLDMTKVWARTVWAIKD